MSSARQCTASLGVCRLQVGAQSEDAFGGTGSSVRGDLFMTVTRHEVAHQFDRVVARDALFDAWKRTLIAAASSDTDWLRTAVGNSYFQSSPQEIIASQVCTCTCA